MVDGTRRELAEAALIVAAAGLADAFGHVSVRTGDTLLITAPRPLAFQSADEFTEISLDESELPSAVPREAWIHVSIARAHPETRAIVRAQPRGVARAVAAGRSIRALDGQGALLGTVVPVYEDARLVRDRASGDAVAGALGQAPAVILRGNGAVTRGPNLASAVARMWLLERSAELALAAEPTAPSLPEVEQSWWREREVELLARIYDYLVRSPEAMTTERRDRK